MPAGRPSSYDPAYCERVLELGEQGCSVVEMAADIGVARTTLERLWPEQYPEFMQALEQARLKSQAWWEKTGRYGMISNNISAPIWSRSMSARFPADWREVKGTELTGANGGPIETNVKRIERVVIDPANPDPA